MQAGAVSSHTPQMATHDLKRLMVEHQPRLFRRAYQMLGDRQSAEDLAQETWVRAHLGLSGYRGGSFLAWLERILRNACIDEIRRTGRQAAVSLDAADADADGPELQERLADTTASVEEAIERSELSEHLRGGLRRLPADQRAAIALIDIYELDYREAARALGVPVGTVKSRVSRARAFLRIWLSAPAPHAAARRGRPERTLAAGLPRSGGRHPNLAL